MKNLLLFLGLVLSLPSLVAGSIVDTVVVSAEDILAEKAPVTCDVFRRKDGSVSFKLGVRNQSGAKDSFEGFDLRVLKKPIPASDIKGNVLREELLAWHRPGTRAVELFVLTEEEIPKGYIVARWSLGQSPSGMLQVRQVCFSMAALVDAANKGANPAPTPVSVTPPAAQKPRQPPTHRLPASFDKRRDRQLLAGARPNASGARQRPFFFRSVAPA